MARKKLFGNHIEPSCETCALGMVSSDGETVLCRHAGAPSKHHHCKRFRYDPLKRTPRRQPPPASFTAADFSLDDPTEDLIPPRTTEEPLDPSREAMRSSLRTYLDGTDSPSADDILELLSVSSADTPADSEPVSDTTALLREADALLEDDLTVPSVSTDDAPEDEPATEDTEDDIPAEDDVPADSDDAADTDAADTDDSDETFDVDDLEPVRSTALASEDAIRRDMELFSFDRVEGASTRAALGDFTVHFPAEEEEAEEPEELPVLSDHGKEPTALFFDPGVTEDEGDSMLSDDLLFLDLDDLDGETIEALKLNDDGTLSSSTEDL